MDSCGDITNCVVPSRHRVGIAASCTGIDAQLARLEERYCNDLAVTRRLDAFDAAIEKK